MDVLQEPALRITTPLPATLSWARPPAVVRQ